MTLLESLHNAIFKGDIQQVTRLAEFGADINATYIRETAFTQALESGHPDVALRIMKLPNFDPNAGNQFNRSPLFCVAKEGHYEMAVALLEMGAEVDESDIRGVTPLGATCWYNQQNVAKLLIARGANINQQDDTGESPLFRACASVSSDVVKVLIDNGVDVNLPTYETNSSCPNFTPLMASLPSKYQFEVRKRNMSEMIALTKLMISSGCDLNAVEFHGRTALHVAVERNELYGACLLIENGCDLEVRDKEGLTAFQLAINAQRPNYEMALTLLLNGADVNTRFFEKESGKDILPLTTVLKTRLEQEECDIVFKHRARLLNALIPATDFTGLSCDEDIFSNIAEVQEGDYEILQEFGFSHPSSLNNLCRLVIRKLLGGNILKKVEGIPIPYQMRKFIAMNIDYKRCSPIACCAMMTSIQDNDASTLKDLLSRGSLVDIRLGDKTPLTLAAQCGNSDVVKILLNHGADPIRLDERGQSALHIAAGKGCNDVVNMLLETRCNVNVVNENGNTPVQEAANMGHFETVIDLLKQGANSSFVGPGGIPVIHLAAGSGHFEAVQCLLRVSDDKNLLDKFGNTPLHVAASRGIIYLKNNIRLPALYKEEVLEMLDAAILPLTSGTPKYTRSDGVSHIGVLELLLKNQIERGVLNSEKQSALDLARKYFKTAEKLF